MSRRTQAASQDAMGAHIRRTVIAAVPVAALAALAIGAPGTAHAGGPYFSGHGYSDQFKPAGAGGGRRVR
jgi:hypothetical protein